MATPIIEDQIHQFLIEKEALRCKAEEIKTGKKATPKAISKPWTRKGESALCQENDFLVMIDEYDYDLSDLSFQNYCTERGILHIAGEQNSNRWLFLSDYNKSKTEYLASQYFQYAEKYEGKKYKYSDEEMETGWRIILIDRARLQDCWELFCKEFKKHR
jgi:hypothetical protein